MAFADDTLELEQSFRETRELLQRLLKAMQQRRAAWVSVRPSVLAPSSEIEQLSRDLARAEDARAKLLDRIRQALPTPVGAGPDQLHVNVTRIAAALPAASGRSLREASEAASKLARLVRTEVTLGQRLLRFAQHAQSSVHAELQGIEHTAATAGYDRRARNVQGQGAAGRILDGRI